MVRLADLHDMGRQTLNDLECPTFADKPFTQPKPLSEHKVALISSAALIKKGDKAFRAGDPGYRIFDTHVNNSDLAVSHVSVNFDRTAALANIESIFPRQVLSEMAADGEIGSVSDENYSFMGSTDPALMEDSAKELCATLKANNVDSAVFLPV